MLRSMKEIRNYHINAVDGEIGKAYEFYFDDQLWKIRYLVVNVGGFLSRKEVLISPVAINNIGITSIDIGMLKKQIEQSPEIDIDKPVYLQHQQNLHDYYNWPYYWDIGGQINSSTFPLLPASITMNIAMSNSKKMAQIKSKEDKADVHLRSSREVIGYHIQATDGEIGHLDDFIFETDDMNVQYVIVDTKNWIPGKKVLFSSGWINKISYDKSNISVDFNKEQIESSPAYDPNIPINRVFEERLYDFYGRPKYWNE